MDFVTILVAVVTGAVLAGIISGIMNDIKDKLKDPPPRVVIKKGSRTLETFILTNDQLDKLRRELKGNAAQNAVNN